MLKNLSLLALIPLAACGVSVDQFNDEYASLYCGIAAECDDAGLGFDSVEDCEAFIGAFATAGAELAESSDDCDYNKDNAAACLDALEAATCDDINTMSDCDEVYEGSCS